MPVLKRALAAFARDDLPVEDGLRWGWLASMLAADLWDDELQHTLVNRAVRLVRETGALTMLPFVLPQLGGLHLRDGEFDAAEAVMSEQEAACEATGTESAPYYRLVVSVFRGREDEAHALIEAASALVVPRGDGAGLAIVDWASAFLYNGLARYADALAAARRAREHPGVAFAWLWVLPELVEAAVRTGAHALAAAALDQLAETTRSACSDWGLGIE